MLNGSERCSELPILGPASAFKTIDFVNLVAHAALVQSTSCAGAFAFGTFRLASEFNELMRNDVGMLECCIYVA